MPPILNADFEDLPTLLAEHEVRYLNVGGLAFVYHAKPRYTKHMDLWIEPTVENLELANRALTAFGSPALLSLEDTSEIVQIGVAANRIDLLQEMDAFPFSSAWATRIEGHFGAAPGNWIGLDALLDITSKIDIPRHQEDARAP